MHCRPSCKRNPELQASCTASDVKEAFCSSWKAIERNSTHRRMTARGFRAFPAANERLFARPPKAKAAEAPKADLTSSSIHQTSGAMRLSLSSHRSGKPHFTCHRAPCQLIQRNPHEPSTQHVRCEGEASCAHESPSVQYLHLSPLYKSI